MHYIYTCEKCQQWTPDHQPYERDSYGLCAALKDLDIEIDDPCCSITKIRTTADFYCGFFEEKI